MKQVLGYVVLLVVLMSLGGCRDQTRSGYVALAGRIFVFNPRVNSVTYVVTLDRVKPIPEGARVIASFDNPAGGDALVVDQVIWPKLARIAIESPQLTCVQKDQRYHFKIRLVGTDGVPLQELESSILSSLDQSVMPDAPLVVGPAYEPNPELQGEPSGKIPGKIKPTCPVKH